MKRLTHLLASVAILASLSAGAAFAQSKDIVTTAVEAGSFKTLAAALKAADLVEALQGEGPFTVFAPTDDAFAKLPEGTVETLLKPENKSKLAGILTYHVAAGKLGAKEVTSSTGTSTLNGQRVDFSVSDGAAKVDNATVVKADIECSNGVIHVIDSVILPADKNIVETAAAADSFKTLIAAAKAAGLAGALSGEQPLTVFAPTDDAFAKLPEGTVASLLKPENKSQLAAILKYHVVPGRVYSPDALAAGTAKTLQGASVTIAATDGGAKVNDATLLKTDLDASNGVIHVIDSVLLPPADAKDKVGSAKAAKQQIEQAISRGARLYNAGHHGACASVYMTTIGELMDTAPMSAHMTQRLEHVTSQARHTTCPTARSWALRHELDRVYAYMTSSSNR